MLKYRGLQAPYFFLFILVFGMQGCGPRFSHSVQQVQPSVNRNSNFNIDYTDSTITLAAGKHYGRSKFHTLLYGKHYRTAWTTPVQVKVLDISKAHGGLTPVQLGGSRQTINLRLEDSAGTEYVLRSVNKEPASALPEKWQQSYFANIIRDATSATHPYAALTLPAMSEAIGIYYTKPELVYVPHDPNLGKYVTAVGGMMALLEKRPSGAQTTENRMGNAPNVVSTRTMLEERLTDNDNRINARHYLRSRLFDMLIGDWSRHEDNWRWAEFAVAKGFTYSAIPRDRDNVFFKLNDAPIPWLFMQLGIKPHFQTFRSNLKNITDLNRSGRNLDELILPELSLSDWQEIADSVQQQLTDQVIEQAFKAMPEPVYKTTAAPIIDKFKARRDQLSQIAKAYYAELNHTVQIVGTDKHELFEVNVISKEKVQVKLYKSSKSGEILKLLWQRNYFASETDELQLYGLNGNDHFVITGKKKPNIKIKIWGGAGQDMYTVEPQAGRKTHINDTQYRNTFDVNKHTSVDIDDDIPAKYFDAAGWLLRYYLD